MQGGGRFSGGLEEYHKSANVERLTSFLQKRNFPFWREVCVCQLFEREEMRRKILLGGVRQ
jgi:hypothetical protein